MPGLGAFNVVLQVIMTERKNEAAWVESRKRWQINVQANGIRKTFTSSKAGKKGKIEAEHKADEWLQTQIIGGNTRCSVLLDLFLAQKKQTTSHTNSSQIEYHIRYYIRPVIGLKRIDRVTEDDLQAIIDRAHAAGRYHKTLTNIRATTQAFIKFCRKKKVTALFPENITIPRNAPKKEKHIAEPDDIRKLFTFSTTYWHLAERFDWYIHAYRFSVLTGLRPGELLGLQWSDIHNERITIRRSINDDGELTAGKNENAHRTLALQGIAQKELDAQRDMLRRNAIVSPYIFPTPESDVTAQKRYRNSWQRYCKYHGLTKTTPYELRHTYVSLNDEMPDGLKKKAIGHSKNMDTEGVYGHLKTGDLERIAQYSDAAVKKIIN